MASATSSRATSQKPAEVGLCGVAALAVIYAGTMLCYDADGYIVDGADTAGYRFAGVAREDVSNAAGADGDKDATFFREGTFKFASSGLTAADVGKPVFLIDNQTVGLLDHASVDMAIYVGVITEVVSATLCFVDIDPAGIAGWNEGTYTEATLSGNTTLKVNSAELQLLNPNGAHRDVTLPAYAAIIAAKRKRFLIMNTAGAANNLVVKDAAGTTIATLNQNEAAWFFCNGTAWKHGGIQTIAQS